MLLLDLPPLLQAEEAALDDDGHDDERKYSCDDNGNDGARAQRMARDLHARAAGVGGTEY